MEELIHIVFKDFYADKSILGYTTLHGDLIKSTYKIETADEDYISEAFCFMSKEEAENIHLILPLILFEQTCRFWRIT